MITLALYFVLVAASADDILLENKSDREITVWIQRQSNLKYDAPIRIRGNHRHTLSGYPRGKYYIVIRDHEGSFYYLGWKDFSRVNFALTLRPVQTTLTKIEKYWCAKCQKWHTREVEAPPDIRYVPEAKITEEVEYRCSGCGKIHSKTVPIEWRSER